MLSRAEFLKLTKLDVDSFTALKRRDLLPLHYSDGRNSYEPIDALLTKLMLGFIERGLKQPVARGIIRQVTPGVFERQSEFDWTPDPSLQIHTGILEGQINTGTMPVIGTLHEIHSLEMDHTTIGRCTLNLTLTAETLRATASYENINLDRF